MISISDLQMLNASRPPLLPPLTPDTVRIEITQGMHLLMPREEVPPLHLRACPMVWVTEGLNPSCTYQARWGTGEKLLSLTLPGLMEAPFGVGRPSPRKLRALGP